ncbi:hypothetical protein C2E23DRAFT_869110 [Lenzites betulinus]|nr:hypothetical protein C2E23DRAFT_869110 [Lenzites betulinus]
MWDQGTLHPRELGEPLEYWATAFTRDFGPTPVRVISLYCRGCHTRYYPNYFLHDQASTRTYYSGVPRLLQVAQHSFVSADVCEMFSNLMAVAWTSATNCARFYNSSLAPPDIAELLPIDWEYSFEVDTEQVWDSFFLYSLLLDHQERQTTLILPHVAPSQAYRLKEAIHARNMIMAGPGQEHWSHACDLCCWVHQTEDGTAQRVRSVITDGVGIGHPCCGVHDCKLPLIRAKGARYCAQHSSMEAQCSVLSCPLAAEKGFRTCAIPEHRQLDEHLQLENKAITLVEDGSAEDSELEIRNEEVECNAKSPEGNKRIRALFGRRRTHNEELAVASCGVILGRATFYGSEAIGGVLEFWKGLFPTVESLPEVLWHDQNCRLWSTLQNADQDTQDFFARVALPVDVFHFKCKHKEGDIVCGTHCNPYIWPELRTDDGKWRFNSSAAEQANVWFGKFLPIVREMEGTRFNFFLDEMIKRRNRLTVKELRRKGHRPYLIPRETLLSDTMTT